MTLIPLPPLTELDYTMPQVWDSTMIVAARECPTKFLYAYVNHIRGDGLSLPLHFGGAFAKGLEAYRKTFFETGNEALAFEASVAAIILAWGDQPSVILHNGKPDKRTLDRCIILLRDYFHRWPIATDALQPHVNEVGGKPTFEFSFAVPLESEIFPRMDDGSPFILTGRADTLGTFENLPVVEDDKTTIMMGDKWAEQWYTRHQFITYIYALRAMGFKTRHVIVRGACVRAEENAFAETTPIHRPDHLLEKFEYELAWTLVTVQSYLRNRTVPRNFGNACYSHFRKCQFWDICQMKPAHELPFLRAMPRAQWDPLHLSITGDE